MPAFQFVFEDVKIKALSDEVARLTALLNRDGTNTGTPTAKTPLNKKKVIPNSREKTDRSKGGQPGHPKHSMEAFSEEEITEVTTHEMTICSECGSTLREVRDVPKDELDYEVKVVKKRHIFKEYVCDNCGKTVRTKDPSLKAENQYGPAIQATALALMNLGFVSMNRTRSVRLVTFVILALNVIGLIYEYSVGEQMAVLKYGMYQGALEDGEYLRLLVSGFLHFGLYHFGSNMICLVLYGFDLEVKVGSGRYALIYFIALLGSSLLINFTGGNGIHAGASGAIWGLMTATLIFNVRHGLNAAYALRGIVLNLIYSFSANVSWQGHIGGGVSGLIAAAAL